MPRLTVPTVLAAVTLLVAPGWAADAQEAAFGLRWDQSEGDLKAAGVVPSGVTPKKVLNGSVAMYDGIKLSKAFEDIEACSLLFTRQHELAKIYCASKNVENDPYGDQMKARYSRVKSLISGRYGKGKSIEFQDHLWQGHDEWWMSMKTKRGSWSTFWDNDTSRVMLDVEGLSGNSGFYDISLEHKVRWKDVHSQKEKREEGQF